MRLFITLLLSSVFIGLYATPNEPLTYKIIGQVVEKKTDNGIPYATVTIENDSLKLKKVLATDASGRFTLQINEPEKYTITISSTGNKEFSIPVTIAEKETNLGKLQIEELVKIGEVTITAQKPLVKVEPDKIIYNMESDPESQTNNALEMLRKVPLVTVDSEEKITLNGQTNFKVLLNGKSSLMMSTNLKEVLKSLPANTIKDIEVITNPSSKYDAEGVGGIINIITTKKTISGYNGSISAGIDSRGSYNGNLYLAAKISKFSFSGRYYGSQFRQPESGSTSEGTYFNSDDYHYTNSNGTTTYKGLSNGFSGEASYEIDTLNLISLSFWGYNGAYTNEGNTQTEFRNTLNEITRMYSTAMTGDNSHGGLSGNIDYQRTFKKPDQSLTFSYKLDNNPRTTNNTTHITGTVNYPSYKQESKNVALGREQTFQADYFDPLTKVHQVEGGVKFILRQNTSESEIYRNDTVKMANSNNLDYDQYIMGAYLGYLMKLKKLSIKTGMRLERTWNDGISKTSGIETPFTNRLFNLVPYITFSYMPTQSQTIKLSYTQRLSRPDIWYLNPYVNNSDSMNISYGNPQLDAEVSHSFELNYSYFTQKFNLSATPFAYLINNSIEDIITVNPNGIKESTYENIGKNQRYGLNIYASFNPSPKINFYLNGGGNYTKMEANTNRLLSNEGFSYRAFIGGRFTLWKNGTVNLNGGIYSPDITLQGKSSSYYYTGIGVSQYFLKRKLMISLSANDPFWKTKSYDFQSEDTTFSSSGRYTYMARTVRFSVTYNFGQMGLQVKKASRGINNDDVKSGGGNSQGGSGQ
jgi:outer membrane receptor for ferrienterochelin and colicin